jgi:Mor family transcriptional regulator
MASNKPRYNEKVDRNNEIYQDRLQGLSWSKLSIKYNLTIKTIHTIVKRLERENEIQPISSHNLSHNTNPNQE